MEGVCSYRVAATASSAAERPAVAFILSIAPPQQKLKSSHSRKGKTNIDTSRAISTHQLRLRACAHASPRSNPSIDQAEMWLAGVPVGTAHNTNSTAALLVAQAAFALQPV